MPRLTSARAAAVVGALALTACSDLTSPERATTPSEIAVPRSRLEAHVRVLAHDSMCGRLVGTDYERQAGAYIADQFAEWELVPMGEDGYFQTLLTGPLPRDVPPATSQCASEPTSLSRNVIGAVPGAGPLAAQWVVVGAHYDHLGWDGADGVARVFNGADDNASGTAVVLEVARSFAVWVAAHPEAAANRRSVMFHAYGAEEIGLFGSRHFVSALTVPGGSIHAMVNLDMVGRLREQTLIVAGTATAPWWEDLLARSRPEGLNFLFGEGSLQRSDQWSFISLLGVPGLHLFTGTHADYHTTTDDPQFLDYGGMQTVARLTLALVWDLMTDVNGLEVGPQAGTRQGGR